jgi:hypothetical protein
VPEIQPHARGLIEPAWPWPKEDRPLTTEQAIEAIETGRHNTPVRGSVTDVACVALLCEGLMSCALSPDGTLQIQSSKYGWDEWNKEHPK